MKITTERNPYLKRLSSSNPHKYSYDIQKGKYFIHDQNGIQKQINKIGTYKPKFKHYFSGYANHKQRYNQGINNDPAFMHYVPDFTYDNSNSYYTPMLDKMAGYTQYPYKLRSQQLPGHLNKASQKISLNNSITMKLQQKKLKKSLSLIQNKPSQSNLKSSHISQSSTHNHNKNHSIFQHSISTFHNPQQKDKYFNLSFNSITQSKPLPRKSKRTCYNYKCKHLKYFVFDEKGKVQNQNSTKYSFNTTNNLEKTLNKSFYQTSLKMIGQENKLIDQIST